MLAEGQGLNGLLAHRVFGLSSKQAQAVLQGYGRYVDAACRGNLYSGANPAGTSVTTQAGLSATTPALTLYNPQGSNVLLVLYGVTIAPTASPAAACAFMLAANNPSASGPSNVTLATMFNAIQPGGQMQGKGRCYSVATLAAAPVAVRYLGGTTGASAIGGVALDYDLGGSIVIPEGGCISIQTTSSAAILASFLWEEIPAALSV